MKHDRRRVTLCGMLLVSVPAIVTAQPAPRSLRVAILTESTEVARRASVKLFVDRLAQLGYVQGTNLSIETRHAGGVPARLPALRMTAPARPSS